MVLAALALMAIRTYGAYVADNPASRLLNQAETAVHNTAVQAKDKVVKSLNLLPPVPVPPLPAIADIPTRPGDAVFGPAGATVQIVVFGNLACAACRAAMLNAYSVMHADPVHVRVIIKLVGSGEPDEQVTAANMFTALALKQNKFWDMVQTAPAGFDQYVDYFARQGMTLQAVRAALEQLSQGSLSLAGADAADAQNAGIENVPAVYVNGLVVSPPAKAALEQTVRRLGGEQNGDAGLTAALE